MLQLHYPERQPLLEPVRSQALSLEWASVLNCFIFPAVAAYLLGYDIGAVPGAVRSLTSEESSGTSWWDLSGVEELLVRNGGYLGAIAASLALVLAGNRWGRVSELICAGLCHLVGGLGAFAAAGPYQLIGWRLLGGVGMGLSLHAGTIYIAETCPAQVRGMLICLKEAFLVVGILLGYLVSDALKSHVAGWRGTFVAVTPAALLLLAGALYLPESPRWIMLNAWQPEGVQAWLAGGSESTAHSAHTPGYVAARAALIRSRGRSNIGELLEAELAGIAASVREARRAGESPLRLLVVPLYYRPLLAGLCVMLLQQVTGQAAIMFLAASVLSDAGAASSSTRQEEVVGALRLLMTLVAAANVDIWGRRPLLLFGASGMFLSITALAGVQLPGAPSMAGEAGRQWASVAAVLLFICCYQVSLGPLVWVAVAEMFPLAVRGPALAAANCAGLTSSMLVAVMLPWLHGTLGALWMYGALGVLSLLSLAAVWALVPELKGKSLEEVEATWGGLQHSSASTGLPHAHPQQQPHLVGRVAVGEQPQAGSSAAAPGLQPPQSAQQEPPLTQSERQGNGTSLQLKSSTSLHEVVV